MNVEPPDAPPPPWRTWGHVYATVLAALAIQIALFGALTWWAR